MSTLATRIPPPAEAVVVQDSDPTAATLLAVALNVPGGGREQRIDLAAVALRPDGERYTLVGDYHCVLHAGMPATLIAESCRLPLDQVTDRTPVAVALGALERYLTAPPYVLLTHQAEDLRAMIARYADACPALNAARMVDTAALARGVLDQRCPSDLRTLTAHIGVSATPRPMRTVTDAALTGALYAHLQRLVDGCARVTADARPARPRPNELAGHAQASRHARSGRKVRRGQSA